MTTTPIPGIIAAMGEPVIPLTVVGTADAERVGPKAASLGTLAEAGFPVPPGLCVTTDAFRAALAPYRQSISEALEGQNLRDPAIATEVARGIADLLGGWTIPDEIATAVRESILDLGDGPVAVRSSATAEDLVGASFAGQYDTILGVEGGDGVLGAILACWRSFFHPNALAARAEAEIGNDEAMAVLVQRMIPAEVAGVAFSVDPVARDRDTTVINAAWGMGVGVVDGTVPCDTYWVRRIEFEVERRRRHVVEQDEQLVVREGRMERLPVPEERRRSACLPDAWAKRIAEYALAAEWIFGRAQDIEWAIEGNKVWILQSRPVTGLPQEVVTVPPFPVEWDDDQDRKRFWTLGWLNDCRVFLPLEDDYIDMHYAAGHDAGVFWGADAGQTQVVQHNGRRFHSRTGGGLHEGDRRIRREAGVAMARRLAVERRMNAWDVWGPEIIATTDKLRSFDLAGASREDLLTHYEDTLGAYRRHWTLHWFGFTPLELFAKAYTALTGIEGQEAENAVVTLSEGQETPFTELMDGLYRLGCIAREVPTVRALVESHPVDALQRLREMPEADVFLAELERFLERFRERTGSGYGTNVLIMDPTWGETPEVVLALTAPYLDERAESPRAMQERTRREREARVEDLCASRGDPEVVAEFRMWLEMAKREAAGLEIHNYYIDQMAMAHVRLATLEIGRRFVASGVIEERDDVLWLRQNEIIALCKEEAPTSQSDLIAERKARHTGWGQMTPPPVLGVPPRELPERTSFKDDVDESVDEPGLLRGEAASPGTVRGRARVVSMDDVLPAVGPGEILVAENAGPLWTPLFPHLGGIVLDAGAFAQHACTTAREFGVPAVINTHHATRRIPDGAWVILDGAAGTVTIEDGQSREGTGTVEGVTSSLS